MRALACIQQAHSNGDTLAAPGVVGALQFVEVLLDSVNVSWAAPEQPNGVVRMYRVHYRTHRTAASADPAATRTVDVKEHTTKRWFQARRSISTAVTPYDIYNPSYLQATQLDMNARYEFSVSAETAVGAGPPRTATVLVGPSQSAPRPPTALRLRVADTSVALEWTNAANDDRQPINGYIIQVRTQCLCRPLSPRRELIAGAPRGQQ